VTLETRLINRAVGYAEKSNMLGLGSVITFCDGAAAGTEVTDLGGRWPITATVANGLKAASREVHDTVLPRDMLDVARAMTVTHVRHGAEHGIAATALGTVYTWGRSLQGQLGQQRFLETGDRDFVPPLSVEALSAHRIVQVAAGDHHSVALSGEDSGLPHCAALRCAAAVAVPRPFASPPPALQTRARCGHGVATRRGSAAPGWHRRPCERVGGWACPLHSRLDRPRDRRARHMLSMVVTRTLRLGSVVREAWRAQIRRPPPPPPTRCR